MKNGSIRVRFAPSPTGHLHIGGLRVALFNWLFARHHNGTFLVRIEDTDIERSLPEYTQSILTSLEWAHLKPDEPMVIQSQRIEQHRAMIEALLEQGKAYRCYCPATGAGISQDYFKYDGRCRIRKVEESDKLLPYVVRIKLPLDQATISFNDLIRGEVTFAMDQFDDFIIARSDGTPVYNFVVVIDDAEMNISHIIRGEDHIPNTPKQIILYQACGFDIPQFAHLPLILGPNGAKLSKRDAATAVIDYKSKGYLPDALCNYLVRLGWSHGDQEIFTRDEMITYFTLDQVGKKGAIFNTEKLNWINSIYLRKLSADEILYIINHDVDPLFTKKVALWPSEQLLAFIELYKDRVSTLLELATELTDLYSYDAKKEHNLDEQQKKNIQFLYNQLSSLEQFNAQSLSEMIKKYSKEQSIKLSDITQPLRLIITGKLVSPGIFEIMSLLGRDEVLKRILYSNILS